MGSGLTKWSIQGPVRPHRIANERTTVHLSSPSGNELPRVMTSSIVLGKKIFLLHRFVQWCSRTSPVDNGSDLLFFLSPRASIPDLGQAAGVFPGVQWTRRGMNLQGPTNTISQIGVRQPNPGRRDLFHPSAGHDPGAHQLQSCR